MTRLRYLPFLLLFVVWGCAREPAEVDRDPEDNLDTGEATYYHPSFQGQPTASRDTLDLNALVAAHRTYPFGTRVRVTNLENQRSVVVTIIDRLGEGPTLITLSTAAARQLAMIDAGRVSVRLEPLEEEDDE